MLKRIELTTLLVSVTENGEDTIRSVSKGSCLIEETGIMLKYKEEQNDGTASLLLTDGLADLKRHGQTQSRFTFINARLLPCVYVTPQGALDLSIYTHNQSFEINAQGGSFDARYTLLASGQQVADNTLTIKWNFI